MEELFGEGFEDFDGGDDAAGTGWAWSGGGGAGAVVHAPAAVPGLFIIKNYLTCEEAEHLLCHVMAAGWVKGGANNQAMAFGELPGWVAPVQGAFEAFLKDRAAVGAAFPHRGEPFNQLIVNRYDGSEGIVKHVDLMRFKDGILGLTLCGSAALRFAPVEPGDAPAAPVEYFVGQGDAYVLTGPARYAYTHEIPERPADRDERAGCDVLRSMRVSLTLRRLVD